MEQVKELETAILSRANRLAVEYRERAERSRDNIMQEAHKRLHLREEREVLLAKSKAERTFRRQVQANELKLQKEMDHLRWNLVIAVQQQLRDRIGELVADETSYLLLLKQLMASAARSFKETELRASFNTRDRDRLQPIWDNFYKEAVQDKTITLETSPINTIGGVIISSHDRSIRFDNTFEGREERLADNLHQTILERLFPAGTVQDNLSSMR
ncbi:MAG: V-type ATP synthase subunit E family protein [Sedimenticola sp.]|nr:V-type ATP synthase subunit E family protein [Sedimenticola sp.]